MQLHVTTNDHVLDRQGKKLVHTNVKDNDFKFFLKLVEPYKHDLTVYCLCFWTAPRSRLGGNRGAGRPLEVQG